MPRKSSRPKGWGNAREVDEETNPAEYQEYFPGWDGTIDPRDLSAPGIPTTLPADEGYALPSSSSHSHYPNYTTSSFYTEGDAHSYMTDSLDFANYISAPPEVEFDAVAGQNLEFIPDNSGFGASGIDPCRANQLDNFSTPPES